MAEDHKFTNRLIAEKSLYLQQHAHNPVDWYPWGQEAFSAAQEQDKPIFLSIGYTSCHWCHVMEEEVFSDEEAAKVLNDAFICIKVDREEMPEVDALYMEFAQAMIVGSSGWPLNVLLTPELKPFFAATYLPKNTAKGLVGIMELTEKIKELWESEGKEKLLSQAEKILELMQESAKIKGDDELPAMSRIDEVAAILFKVADPIWGGMKGAPKFPIGYQVEFLLHYYHKTKEVRALYLAEKTLEMMHRGGIYDHIGGGFHRYSVDEKWMIPHFEKMLYDNAILASAYIATWRATQNPLYRQVAEETLNYLLTMRGEEGGFSAAEDADSAGVEGLYYTWTLDEMLKILGQDLGGFVADYYSVTRNGNFEGRSVLYMAESFEEFSEEEEFSREECKRLLENGKEELLKARKSRIKPLRDDKIITSWNGLAIHAFAQAGLYFQNEEYLQAAKEAAEFIRAHLYKEGVLYRRYREGETRFRAGLDDYVFYIRGLLSLFEAGGGTQWLQLALELADAVERNFKAEEGAFYQSDSEEMTLPLRKCHFSDGAEPSGNAVHAENLLFLYQMTWDKKYLKQAEDIFKRAKRFLDSYPLGYCYHLLALSRLLDEKKSTLLLSIDNPQFRNEVVELMCHKNLPHTILLFHQTGDGLEKLLPNLPEQDSMRLCYEGICEKPIFGKEAIMSTLQNLH